MRVDTQVTRDAGDLLPLVRSHCAICVGQAKEEGDELNPVLNAHVPSDLGTDIWHRGFFLNDAFEFAETLLGLRLPKPFFEMFPDEMQFAFIYTTVRFDDYRRKYEQRGVEIGPFF